MSGSRKRQLKRERQRRDRRRDARENTARITRAQQEAAAARQDLALRSRHHRQAYALYTIAAVIAIGHFFEHADAFQIVSPGFQDLVLGWPMAGVLALVGAIRYGR